MRLSDRLSLLLICLFSSFTQAQTCGVEFEETDLLYTQSFIASCSPINVDGADPICLPIHCTIIRDSNGEGFDGIERLPLRFLSLLNEYFEVFNIKFYFDGPHTFVDDDNIFNTPLNPNSLNQLEPVLSSNEAINLILPPILEGGSGYADYPGLNNNTNWLSVPYLFDGLIHETVVHEMGHYFSLLHTFEFTHEDNPPSQNAENVARFGENANCDWAGDQLCDTDADPNCGVGFDDVDDHFVCCNPFTDIHGETYHPPATNLMGYQYALMDCSSELFVIDQFTPGQELRMSYGLEARLSPNNEYTLNAPGEDVPLLSNLEVVGSGTWAQINWSEEPENSLGFILEYSTTSDSEGYRTFPSQSETSNQGIALPNEHSILASNLDEFTQYWFRVRAVNSNCNSGNSNPVYFYSSHDCTPQLISTSCNSEASCTYSPTGTILGVISISSGDEWNYQVSEPCWNFIDDIPSDILLIEGNDVTIELMSPNDSDGNYFVDVWLDADGDDGFTNEEKVYSSNGEEWQGNSSHHVEFTCPELHTIGNTILRIIVSVCGNLDDPCEYSHRIAHGYDITVGVINPLESIIAGWNILEYECVPLTNEAHWTVEIATSGISDGTMITLNGIQSSVIENVAEFEIVDFADGEHHGVTITIDGNDGSLFIPDFLWEDEFCSATFGPLSIDGQCAIEICRNSTSLISDLNIAGGTEPYTFEWIGPDGYHSTEEFPTIEETGFYYLDVTDALGAVQSIVVNAQPFPTVFDENDYVKLFYCPDVLTEWTLDLTMFNIYGPVWHNGVEIISGIVSIDDPLVEHLITYSDENCTHDVSVIFLEGDDCLSVNESCNGAYFSFDAGQFIPSELTPNASETTLLVTEGNPDLTLENHLSTGTATDYLAYTSTTVVAFDNWNLTIENLINVSPMADVITGIEIGYGCDNLDDGWISLEIAGQDATVTWQEIESENLLVENLFPGSYTVTVEALMGEDYCTETETIIIPEAPTLNEISTAQTCNISVETASIEVSVANGTSPFEYSWTGDEFNSSEESITDLQPGLYSVVITDANGCVLEESDIEIYPSINIEAEVTNISCFGLEDGSISVESSGGMNQGYTFVLLNSEGDIIALELDVSSIEVQSLGDDNYSLSVGDGTCLIDVIQYTVPEPDELSITAESINAYSCLDQDQSEISIEISGGTVNQDSDYSIYWTSEQDPDFSSDQEELLGIVGGEYTVDVLDLNGCSMSLTVVVADESPMADIQGDLIIQSENQENLDGALTRIDGNLIISNETAFEISNANLEFTSDHGIVIQNGSQLNLDNCILSDFACPQPMWQGIEVHGDPSFPGILNISGNSTIENAHIGVLVGERNASYTVDSETSKFISSKGEAHIDGCTFSNCGYGIYVHQSGYSNDYTPPLEMPVEITNCIFETVGVLPDPGYLESSEDPYPNESNPYVQSNFLGRGNTGITIFRRPYVLIDDVNIFDNIETGIEQYLVRNDVSNCIFRNLRYGIRGWGGYFHPKVTMNQSILSNQFVNIRDPQDPDATIDDPLPVLETYSNSPTAAIELNGVQFFTINENDILTPNAGDFTENGIILDNSARFQVKRIEINDSKRGVVIIDSYPDDFENLESPYWIGSSLVGQSQSTEGSNDFFDCEAGILTDENNVSLHLRCNNHNNGILVGDKPYESCWANSGLILDQGRQWTPADDPDDNHLAAGNQFDPVNEKLIANYLEEQPTDYDYEYVHHEILNSEQEHFRPETVDDVDVLRIEDLNQQYDVNSSCDLPISLWTGNNHSVVHQQVISKTSNIDGLIGEHQELKSSLDSWYTQTEAMLNSIYGSSNQQELRDFLLENSPLSEPVLAAYMARYDVPHEYLADVVYANSVVEGELRDLLQDRIDDMPAAIAAEIEAVMSYNPDHQTLTQLKKQIEHERSWLGLSVNEWVKSVTTENDLDNMIALLESDVPDLSFQYYLSQGNYLDAQRVLDDIISENSSIQDWLDISAMELNVLQSGRDYDQLTSGEIAQLQLILDNSSMGSEARSRAEILLACSGEFLPTHVPLLNVIGGDRSSRQKRTLEVTPRIYPNPAHTYFQFECAVGTDDFAYVVVRNSQGKVVETNVLFQGSNRHLVECEQWSSGIYLLELFVNNKSIWTGKITRQ